MFSSLSFLQQIEQQDRYVLNLGRSTNYSLCMPIAVKWTELFNLPWSEILQSSSDKSFKNSSLLLSEQSDI